MSCEKCWGDAAHAALLRGGSQTDHYRRLLEERQSNPCSPEEQCGELHTVYDLPDGTQSCACGRYPESPAPTPGDIPDLIPEEKCIVIHTDSAPLAGGGSSTGRIGYA